MLSKYHLSKAKTPFPCAPLWKGNSRSVGHQPYTWALVLFMLLTFPINQEFFHFNPLHTQVYAQEPLYAQKRNSKFVKSRASRTPKRTGKKNHKGESYLFDRLEFKGTKVTDALRLIAEKAGVNAVATKNAGKQPVTLYLKNVTARQAIDTLCRLNALWYRWDKPSQTFRVLTTKEYQKDIIVFRDDTIEVFRLKHPNVTSIATAIENLYGIQRVSVAFAQSDSDAFGRLTITGGLGFGAGLGLQGNANRLSGGTVTTRGRTVTDIESVEAIDEDLTAEQIAALEKRAPELIPGTTTKLSEEQLGTVSKKEAPIYVSIVRQHNTLIVRTSDTQALEDIKKLVKELDRPTRQVLLEMKILSLQLGDSFKSIFDFSIHTGSDSSGPPDGEPPNPFSPISPDANRNILGVGNFPFEAATFVYQFLSDSVRARIELAKQNNRIETIATPMVMASNLEPARIFVGEQRVLTTGVETDVITAANVTQTTVINPITEVRDIGTTLIISPTINLDNTVSILITQDNSTLNEDAATIPVSGGITGVEEFPIDTVDTANILGTVVAKNNLTLAIGGLIRTQVNHNVEKTPFLGDLPWIGTLFRKEVDDNLKQELVLLITPHIIGDPHEEDGRTIEVAQKWSRHTYFERGETAIDGPFNKDPDLEPVEE